MLILIRNAQVFAPEPLGICDVLVAGACFAAVGPNIELKGDALHCIDAGGRWLLPGLVDPLTHPTGGGGEGGFGNRTSELLAQDFIAGGVTTPVGALGTDSITRSLESLYGKTMSLRSAGLSAYMFSGSYRVPPNTLTGDLARDMVLVDPVIGVGEVAIADHRSSQPDVHEFRRLAADVQLGGTISGKTGTVLVHVGDSESGLDLIEAALAGSDLPRRLFYPTHINRQERLLKQAVGHTRDGGYADITVSTTPELLESGEVAALDAFRQAVDAGAPPDRLTLSSDAGGSLPLYRNGELAGIEKASPGSQMELLRTAIRSEAAPPVELIAAMTRNPADALALSRKGRIAAGKDADFLLIDPQSGQLTDVVCRGRWLMRDQQIQNENLKDNRGA